MKSVKYLIVHRPVGSNDKDKQETVDANEMTNVESILHGAIENGHECKVYSEDGNTLLGQVENGVAHVHKTDKE